MAKRFLETLDDTLGDEVLADLIPGSSKAPARKRPSRSASGSGKRKSFRAALEDVKPTAPKKKASGKKKSFLGALEEVFEGMDDRELDQLFPTAQVRKEDPVKKEAAHITASIDRGLLARIRKIAREHQVSVEEVVQEALRLYLAKKG